MGIPAASLSTFPLTLGKQAGIFERHGIDVTISQLNTNAAIAAAVSSQIDYVTPAGSLIRAIGQGAPLRVIVTIMDKSNHLMIVNPKVIKEGKDLAGKGIAINSLGDNTQLEAEAVLKHYGVDPKSVQFASVQDDGQKLAAIQSGAVDAAINNIPWNFKAEQMGFKVLINLADIFVQPTSVLATSTDNIAKHAATIQEMVNATRESTEYARTRKSDAVQLMAKEYDMSQEEAATAYDLTKDAWSADGQLSAEAFKNATEPLNLNPPLSIEKVVDSQFLQKASTKG